MLVPRLVSAVVVASLCVTPGVASSILSSSSCSASGCGPPTSHDDSEDQPEHVALLQTHMHIGHAPAPKAPSLELQALRSGTHTDATVAQAQAALAHGVLNNVSCSPLLPIEARSKVEILRHLGGYPEPTACLDFSASLLSRVPALVLPQVAAFPSGVLPQISHAFVVMLAYLAFVALTIACILRAVEAPSAMTTTHVLQSPTKTPRFSSTPSSRSRPELEAWNEGLISWFLISWVSPWMSRWGDNDNDNDNAPVVASARAGARGSAPEEGDCGGAVASNSSSTKIRCVDLGGLGSIEDETAHNFVELSRVWGETIKNNAGGVVTLIVRFAGIPRVVCIIVAAAVYEIMAYVGPPYAVNWVLNFVVYMNGRRALGNPISSDELAIALLKIILMFTGFVLVQVVFNTVIYLLNSRTNTRLLGGLGAMVYKKAQRLPLGLTKYDLRDDFAKEIKDDWGMGDNANASYNLAQLFTVDINGYFVGLIYPCAQLVSAVPILFYLVYALVSRLGKATVFSCAAILLTAFWMHFILRNQFYAQRYYQGWGGARTQGLQEFIFGIRMIKSYGWENQAIGSQQAARAGEMSCLRTFMFWSGFYHGTVQSFAKLIVIVSLATYAWMYRNIPASDIFVIVTLLGTFQTVCGYVGYALPPLFMAGPALGRLSKFFALPEAELPGLKDKEHAPWCEVWPKPALREDLRISAEPPRLQVQGCFSWMPGAMPVLHDLDITVEQNQRVAVLGEVGSGKSTLINALLGELHPVKDARLSIPEKIAYHSQVAYVCEGTLKENVLFYESYNEERYNQAIFAASLRQDLGQLPGGDGVPIGSRGITLSGGQRARVSLARAIYSFGTEVVLLDDLFASLDQTTGKHVMDHVVNGPLMKDRICVCVMQPDEQRLQSFDQVIVIENGAVAVQGKPSEVIRTPAYQKLLAAVDQKQVLELEPQGFGAASSSSANAAQSTSQAQNAQVQKLREDESEGRFDTTTVKTYLNMGGNVLYVTCLSLFVVHTVCNLFVDIVMAHMTDSEADHEATLYAQKNGAKVDVNQGTIQMWHYIAGMFSWLCISWVIFATCFYLGAVFSVNVSGLLYDLIIKRLMKAPIDRFFDRTPVGRILNRLSSDLLILDIHMYVELTASFGQFIWTAVPMVYIHMAMPLLFTIGSMPWYFLLVTMIRRYSAVLIPLRYLERVSLSDVNVFFTEVENARTSMRAYQVGNQFAASYMSCSDNLLTAQFAHNCCFRWVCNRMLVLWCFYSTSIALVGVLIPGSTSLGNVALCLSQVVSVIMRIDYTLDRLTAAQFQFVSLNRLVEYVSIPQERDHVRPGDSKFLSKSIVLKRSDLGKMEIRHSEGTGLISIIRHGHEHSSSGEEVIFEQTSGNGYYLAFRSVRAAKWMSSLMKNTGPPGNDSQRLAAEELDITHRLVGVNDARGDVCAVAQELCDNIAEDVFFRFESSWMTGGAHIKITDLVAGYADIPVDVLKGINITIAPMSRNAICGTTGCGKSTTILCMLRLLEPRSGTIAINHVNTQAIGLKALRSACGLVPQDSIILSGTVKFNLDPRSEYPDSLVWKALKAVQLADMVEMNGDGLQMHLQSDGANLSFGQRQLLCVARMILRQPCLLMLDECTSAIDPRTQERVQGAIRDSFPNSTLMVVAHRLETILDFDRVVVMERGCIVEDGSVKELANNPSGLFHAMLHANAIRADDTKGS